MTLNDFFFIGEAMDFGEASDFGEAATGALEMLVAMALATNTHTNTHTRIALTIELSCFNIMERDSSDVCCVCGRAACDSEAHSAIGTHAGANQAGPRTVF